MEIKIISESENPVLKRKEIHFHVEYDKTSSTPPRLEVRKAVANTLKVDADLLFIEKVESKAGMHVAIGLANLYDSVEQAKLIEPKYIIDRNIPSEKLEEKKEGKDNVKENGKNRTSE